jgi:hypothetical protein
MNPTEPISVIETLPITDVKIKANEGGEDVSEMDWDSTTDQRFS